jgi:hypothetical protein
MPPPAEVEDLCSYFAPLDNRFAEPVFILVHGTKVRFALLRSPSLTVSKSPGPVLPTLPPGFLRKEQNPAQSDQEQEYHRPERSANQGSDESVKRHFQEAEEEAPYKGAYGPYDKIDNQTGSSAPYNLFGQKTGEKSYYQEPNQWLNCYVYSHVFLLRRLVEKRRPFGNSPTLRQEAQRGALFASSSYSSIQRLYLAGQLMDSSAEDAEIPMSPPSPLFTDSTLQLLQISCKSIPIHRITPRYKR